MTFINIIGLCMGIVCCAVILIFVRYELSFDKYHRKASQIYKVVQDTKFEEDVFHWTTTAYPLADALRSDFSEISLVTQASGPVNRLFKIEGNHGDVKRVEEDEVLFVDPYYPQVFDIEVVAGDLTTALKDPQSIILTESAALKFYGTDFQSPADLLGRQVFLNNKDALQITAIVKDPPSHTSLRFKVLIPYEFFRINNPYFASNWSGNYQGTTFVLLAQSEDVMGLTSKIHSWKKKYLKPEDDNRITYQLQQLSEAHHDTVYGSSPGSYVMPYKIIYSALMVGFFILLVACVNFINLATAYAANRAKEIGVRKVLGGSRFLLARQFLTENVLLVVCALVISLSIVQWSLHGINEMLSLIQMNLQLQWFDIFVLLAIGLVVVVLACLYPAVVMSGYQPVHTLKASTQLVQSKGLSLRRSLILLQFFFVQVFVIGTIVVAVQMNYFNTKELGFYKEDPVVTTENADPANCVALRQNWLNNPIVQEVSFSSSAPVSDYNHHYGTSFRLPGQSEEAAREAEMKGADTHYLGFFKLELLAGRNFEKVDPTLKEFIINEEVAKVFGWSPQDAIGQKLVINEGEATIVGVVKNFHNNSLQDPITPCILINWQPFLERAYIKVSANNIQQALTSIGSTWKSFYPERLYHYSFLDDDLAKGYVLEALVLKSFILFSVLTVIIGCLGLYGLLSFMTSRRKKEVGVRKVLGASVVQIIGLFIREFVVLILISFVIAAPVAAFVMGDWLDDFAYRIDLSWWMFALGALATITIVFIAVSYQSFRAANANPVENLKTE
jgi:ABC-type antimicrobial peptide transport system permease subunit